MSITYWAQQAAVARSQVRGWLGLGDTSTTTLYCTTRDLRDYNPTYQDMPVIRTDSSVVRIWKVTVRGRLDDQINPNETNPYPTAGYAGDHYDLASTSDPSYVATYAWNPSNGGTGGTYWVVGGAGDYIVSFLKNVAGAYTAYYSAYRVYGDTEGSGNDGRLISMIGYERPEQNYVVYENNKGQVIVGQDPA